MSIKIERIKIDPTNTNEDIHAPYTLKKGEKLIKWHIETAPNGHWYAVYEIEVSDEC